jgi:CPA2 family monovalent cation:H+ antiporter-2
MPRSPRRCRRRSVAGAHSRPVLEQVLLELALLFALCVGVAVTFHRLRLPPIVGFLVAGVLVGPHGVGLVRHEAMVRELAEVGVIVLLFAVGLEVPLGQLARLRRTILFGGGAQVLGTVVLGAGACWLLGLPWHEALFLGFLLSLSSTAASTKLLVDHGEYSTPHGRLVLAINIAQDLAVVPMILLIPLLAVGGTVGGAAAPSLFGSLGNLGILVVVVVVIRLLLRPVLTLVCRTRSRELFVLLLATLCLGTAVVTAHLGLSLALGAFLAGILLADSDHHSQAAAEVEPFRDAFASLFFVSIGMLFDWRAVAEAPWVVVGGLLAVVAGKAAIVMLATLRLGAPPLVRLRAGLALAQVGEFSFVLVQLGKDLAVLPAVVERVFVVVAVLSIASTPLLYALGRHLAQRVRAGHDAPRTGGEPRLREHAIVVGYGPTGRTLVQGLQSLGIPVVVSETNTDTVRDQKARGVPIVLGDATRIAVLRSLGIEQARTLVVAVNDTAAAARIAQLAGQLAPQVHVLVRSVYIAEGAGLRRAGAHDVVPQELEASVEMLVRVLRRFLVADDEIGRQVRDVRRAAGGGDRLAALPATEAARIAEFVPGIGFAVWRVEAGAPAAGRTLAQAGVRRHTGCSVVAIRRGAGNLPIVTPETVVEPGDTVVVIGPDERLPDAQAMFSVPAPLPRPEPS